MIHTTLREIVKEDNQYTSANLPTLINRGLAVDAGVPGVSNIHTFCTPPNTALKLDLATFSCTNRSTVSSTVPCSAECISTRNRTTFIDVTPGSRTSSSLHLSIPNPTFSGMTCTPSSVRSLRHSLHEVC